MELLGEEFTHMSVRGTKDAMGRVFLVCNDAAAIQQAPKVCNNSRLRLRFVIRSVWLFSY